MKNTIRNTSIIIAVLATAIATTNIALAEMNATDDVVIEHSNKQHNGQRQNPMQAMLNGLDLSEDQLIAINEILDASRPDQNSQQRPSREAHEAMMAKIKALLTDAQAEQFDEAQSNMGGGKRQGKGQR